MTTVPETLAAGESAVGAVGAATALLDDYRPGSDRLLASPTRTLLARGVRAHVPHDTRPLKERVRIALSTARAAGRPDPMVIGAIPFDPAARAELVVPTVVRRAPALAADPLITLPAPEPEPVAWTVRPVPAPERYAAAVAAAVERMEAGEFTKVVLARALDLTGDRDPGTASMLQRLARRDPHGYTFAMPTATGATLLGASPELLVSRRGATLVANPLAGSVPRSEDLAEDVRRAASLLESPKDLHEHSVVVDAMRAALAPFCAELQVPARPTLVRTAAMWHLSTTLHGTLATSGTTSLELASALHPTPAVCGAPTAPARRAIGQLEPFERGLYTGIVGWEDAEGDGEWVVTIRCAEVSGRTLRLFAGAGVVAASDPAAETAETGAKFRTFLDAVGAEL
ncbi:isochorismate synthase DhbC [Streptomyces sp. NPDC058739]|uniref:isochorismate synthase DhbC n=1 Tax=Streptomyces sp. NPDC058739 TaxID=3346618 RepID=UPI0036C8F274